eukprot:5791958-Ditylum_brightwellii.AAC.1
MALNMLNCQAWAMLLERSGCLSNEIPIRAQGVIRIIMQSLCKQIRNAKILLQKEVRSLQTERT